MQLQVFFCFYPLTSSLPTLAVAALLGLVHVFAGRLRFLGVIPRSGWLSFAGGISVSYVFLHLLPELSTFQEVLRPAGGEVLAFLDHHAYLVSLLGLASFYGLERSTKKSRKASRTDRGNDISSERMFWISIVAFACYNAVFGYLLVSQEAGGYKNMALFSLAIALHFIVNDYALRDHHKHLYQRYGRWLLCAAVIAGAIAGLLIEIDPVMLAITISFLSGGIVLNVLKEELPDERESNFPAFALGTVIYAVLLLSA